MTRSIDDFDWDDASQNDAVIQRAVDEVCVYENSFGDIAIRKRADWDDASDTFIVIAKGNAPAFIAKVQEVAGLFSAREIEMMRARPDIDWAAVIEEFSEFESDEEPNAGPGETRVPKDPTAAERMKRYRKRLKERENEEGSDRNGVTKPANDRNELRLAG